MATVTVMTYNILGGREPAALARVVRHVRPDVMLANESPKTPLLWRAHCERLAGDWQLRYVAGGRSAGSNLLLASRRVRVVRSDAWRIAQPLLKPRRGIVVAQLEIESAPFGFVGCHLSLLPDSRPAEVEMVVEAASSLTGPVVVAGDLNERPRARSWERLRSAGFTDAAGADDLTFPASSPKARIDALLVRGEVDIRAHEVPDLGSTLLATASDHLPVTAVLVL